MTNGIDKIRSYEDWKTLTEDERSLYVFLTFKDTAACLSEFRHLASWKRVAAISAGTAVLTSVTINSPTLLAILKACM